jgi:heptosyltransferase-3
MLTLPLAGLLKRSFPDVRITFIGRTYTKPVLLRCAHVDAILTLEELEAGDAPTMLRGLQADALIHVFPRKELARWARSAGIPMRIGTNHRWWHWFTCTHRVAFSRKRSSVARGAIELEVGSPLDART